MSPESEMNHKKGDCLANTNMSNKHLQLSNLRVIMMIIKINESLSGLGPREARRGQRPAEWQTSGEASGRLD